MTICGDGGSYLKKPLTRVLGQGPIMCAEVSYRTMTMNNYTE